MIFGKSLNVKSLKIRQLNENEDEDGETTAYGSHKCFGTVTYANWKMWPNASVEFSLMINDC